LSGVAGHVWMTIRAASGAKLTANFQTETLPSFVMSGASLRLMVPPPTRPRESEVSSWGERAAPRRSGLRARDRKAAADTRTEPDTSGDCPGRQLGRTDTDTPLRRVSVCPACLVRQLASHTTPSRETLKCCRGP
jgi:hypothetical protein